MADEIRTRFHAQGTTDFGGGTSQSVLLSTLSSLNLSLRPGTGESWQQFYTEQTIASSGNYDLDLNNPSNTILDGGGNAVEIETLYWFVVAVVSPDGTKTVRYGPQNVTNGCPLWFGGVTANFYANVEDCEIRPIRNGLGITASTASVVRFHNPSGSDPVTVRIWVAGVKA